MLRHHSRQFVKFFIVYVLSCSIIYTPIVTASQLALATEDLDSPEVFHDPFTETLPPGDVKAIIATATDSAGVKSLVLFYRQLGEKVYQQAVMQRIDASDKFSITLDSQYYQPPGIEYYIQATDSNGNGSLYGHAYTPMILVIEALAIQTVVEGVDVLPTTSENATLSTSETMARVLANTAVDSTSSSKKWLWIGLGVLAAGAIASRKDNKTTPPPSTSLDFEVPAPSTSGN